jgi:hypothetical protein
LFVTHRCVGCLSTASEVVVEDVFVGRIKRGNVVCKPTDLTAKQ